MTGRESVGHLKGSTKATNDMEMKIKDKQIGSQSSHQHLCPLMLTATPSIRGVCMFVTQPLRRKKVEKWTRWRRDGENGVR